MRSHFEALHVLHDGLQPLDPRLLHRPQRKAIGNQEVDLPDAVRMVVDQELRRIRKGVLRGLGYGDGHGPPPPRKGQGIADLLRFARVADPDDKGIPPQNVRRLAEKIHAAEGPRAQRRKGHQHSLRRLAGAERGAAGHEIKGVDPPPPHLGKDLRLDTGEDVPQDMAHLIGHVGRHQKIHVVLVQIQHRSNRSFQPACISIPIKFSRTP